MDKKPNVLYVDDEEHNLIAFKAALRRKFKVFTAISAAEGLEILRNEGPFVVVVSDQRMPETTGIEFFQQIKNEFPEPIRILLTGYADINAVIDAINKGEVYRYLSKPWDEDHLVITLNSAIELFQLREENKLLTEKLKRVNKQLEFLLRQNLIS
ncbi:response regulator [bacterium SCSIO 12741]|nr:response regulator [bacterium SCSIO 12741]